MDLLKIGIVLILYGVLFFAFGSLITCRFTKDKFSVGLTILLGFFLYYLLFQIVAVPMMFAQRSLTELRIVWCVAAVLVAAISVFTSRQIWLDAWKNHKKAEESSLKGKDKFWNLFWRAVPFLAAAVNIILVSVIYSSYWDATYYVGTVSYSVYYDTINTFDPLSGMRLAEFDLRHCLATYHMNDAVICQLFGIHPLIQCKTVMVIVVTGILNLLYYRFACLLFEGKVRAQALFVCFCFLINLCTYSAYTSSSFILLRTYEGKAIAGAIVAMFLLYWFLRLFEEDRREYWLSLFVTAWGAVAISTSAMFIVLVGTGCFGLAQLVLKRKWMLFVKAGICMLPAAVILLFYLLNRIGLFSVPITG